MDSTDIAVAAVVTTGVVGLSGVGAAVWGTWWNGKRAREDRVLERKTDAYLELLRIVEREGLWIDTRVEQLKHFTVDDPYDIEPRPKVAPGPVLTDRATIAALLAAFGSPALREACAQWRETVHAFEQEDDAVMWNATEALSDPRDPMSADLLDTMLTERVPAEARARTHVAEIVAAELGQRSK